MKKPIPLDIPMERITWEGLDIPVVLDQDWFTAWLHDEPELEFTLASPIRGAVHLERHEGNILLRGRLHGELTATCSRCLDSFTQPLLTTFEMLIRIGSQPKLDPELELKAADLDEEYCAGDTVGLNAILREQILLALPLKPLCDDNCLGLCRRCGANLKRETCTCQPKAIQGPLAVLAKWKKEQTSS